MPTPDSEFVKRSAEGLGLAAIALPYTFGLSLLFIPLGMASGIFDAKRASECAERWNAHFGDARAWSTATFSQAAVSDRLAANIKRLTQGASPAIPVEVVFGRTAGEPEAIGQRLSATSIVLVDVWFSVNQSAKSRCGFQFEAAANVAGERLSDRAVLAEHHFQVVDEVYESDIESWAEDPAAGPAWLDQKISQMAERIVLEYPWFAATEVLANYGPQGPAPYCSIHVPHAMRAIGCVHASLEECQAAIAGTPGECIPRTAATPRWCFIKSADSSSWSYSTDCAALVAHP